MQGRSGKEERWAEGREKAVDGGEASTSEGAYPAPLPSADAVKSLPLLLETERARTFSIRGLSEPLRLEEGVKDKPNSRAGWGAKRQVVYAAGLGAIGGLVLRSG
jgi:hypothetical protein